MPTPRRETYPVRSEADIVAIRRHAREWSVAIGLGLVDQTKMVTAASELARNTLIYGRGGDCTFESFTDGIRWALRLSFVDQGPGIPDLALALKDGYTTGSGMGLGLSGSRRLVSEFDIKSEVGKGTTVVITKWK